MKKAFWIDTIVATALTFALLWVILTITKLNLFNAFNSIGQALTDVELTDYAFSNLREDPKIDTNIIVVNIGRLSRRDIAKQIKILSKYQPKVIGIDSYFNCRGLLRDTLNCSELKDTLGNQLLSSAIHEAGDVVMVTRLLQSGQLSASGNNNEFDSLEFSDEVFRNGVNEGYANLETEAAFQDDVKTCRSFNPVISVNGNEQMAFSVRIAMLFDSIKTNRFLRRKNYSEIINYTGNIFDVFHQTKYPQAFYTLDVDEVLKENFTPELVRGKIVIMGYLGEQLGDPSWSDKFYTPLNSKLAGKANPDMFGVVVHANIISMIIREAYIDQISEWLLILIQVTVCFLNIAIFWMVHQRLPDWYDGITKSLQLFEIVFFTVLMVVVFDVVSFKFEVSMLLAAVALAGDSFEIYVAVVKKLCIKFLVNYNGLSSE